MLGSLDVPDERCARRGSLQLEAEDFEAHQVLRERSGSSFWLPTERTGQEARQWLLKRALFESISEEFLRFIQKLSDKSKIMPCFMLIHMTIELYKLIRCQ